MKSIIRLSIFLLLLIVLLFNNSCQKELSCENCKGNKPPIANAGPDQVITLPSDSISLDGTASNDPDGKISEWLWTKISGPASFNIIKPTDSTTKVKVLVTGTYQFELKVTDNGGLSAKDTVQITVNDPAQPNNRPPVANAGADQTITLPTNTVTLDGSGSTDPDNNITNYQWTKISGPSTFNIANASTVQTQVTNLMQGAYQFELKVTDAAGLFSKDTLQVILDAAVNTNCDISNRPFINAQLIPFGTLSAGISMIMSIASAGNKIVFAGGYYYNSDGNSVTGSASTRVDIYDIVTHNWSTAELSIGRFDMGVAVSGNKIFFAGGEDYNDIWYQADYSTIDIYDASTDSWSVDSLSGPRQGPVGAAVGGKVFFAGGSDPYAGSTLNVVDIYNPTTNSWSGATLSESRQLISAITANNKIYFAGGGHISNSTRIPSNRIDIYDNATSSWSTSSLIEPKEAMASIAFGGKIYWAGGSPNIQASSNFASNQVEIKDVNTQTSSVTCLFQLNTHFSAVEKNNKIIFFTSQFILPGIANNKFDIYDTSTNTWSIGVLPVDITGASIISVNNTIYVAGGFVNGVLSNKVWKLEF